MSADTDPVITSDDALAAAGNEGAALALSAVRTRQRATSRTRHLAGIVLPPLVMGAIVLGIWYSISYLVLAEQRRFLLRPPHEVVQVGFLEWDRRTAPAALRASRPIAASTPLTASSSEWHAEPTDAATSSAAACSSARPLTPGNDT